MPQIGKDKNLTQTNFSEDMTIGGKSQTNFSKYGATKISMNLIDRDISFDHPPPYNIPKRPSGTSEGLRGRKNGPHLIKAMKTRSNVSSVKRLSPNARSDGFGLGFAKT